MVKKISTSLTRDSRPQSLQSVASNLEVPKVEKRSLSNITISVESCQNIQSIYSVSNLTIRCIYKTDEIGDASFILTNDPIIVTDFKFTIKCDVDSALALSDLAENPVLLKIIQSKVPRDSALDQTLDIEETLTQSLGSQAESAISLYEAFTGDIVHEKSQILEFAQTKTKRKSKQEIKSSKDNENFSKKSNKSKKSKQSQDNLQFEKTLCKNNFPTETEVGTCVIDLVSIALGKALFSQFVEITPVQLFTDDRMIRHLAKPGLNVTVSIDKPITFQCNPQLLSITFESIFNIPPTINESKNCDVCFWLPNQELTNKVLICKNGIYTTESVKTEADIGWATVEQDYFNKTTKKVDSQITSIRNYVDKVNLEKVFTSNKPRIEFNCLKRNVLMKQDFFYLYDHIRTIHRILVEIHIYQKDLDTKYVTNSTNPTVSNKSDCLHLMAIADLSTLLFPGITKTRIAVPLRTFNEKEACELGHSTVSYFYPAKEKNCFSPVSESKKNPTKLKKKTKTKKHANSSISKKSKTTEFTANTKTEISYIESLKNVNEPSVKIYNKDGVSTFIILQIELSEPFVEKECSNTIHDGCLYNTLDTNSEESTIISNTLHSTGYYHNIIEKIIKEINKHFASYVKKKSLCHCETRTDFLTYLKRIGGYQIFIEDLGDVAAIIAQNKLDQTSPNPKLQEYQRLIEQIFIELTREVNSILQKNTSFDTVIETKTLKNWSILLFYAKEASENKLIDLANRYYLEMLHQDGKNADYWFYYAIFHLENNENEKAFVCVQEALSIKKFHKNSLLLIGILLSKMNRKKDAELRFLTLMIQEPQWVEGWMVLYLFYKKIEYIEGMDHALEMAEKYFIDARYIEDDFQKSEDLVWSSTICPNTVYFKAAIMLVKMRIYSWAEKILRCELQEAGAIHYLLAVICYYKTDYEHALTHLEQAEYFHGSDHNVMSLKGHCYLSLRQFSEAEKNYSYALESYDKPKCMHLLYINSAKVIKDVQKSRKLLLTACENDPTPYTWMACGILYFQGNDFLSAEECFSNSISLDNEIAENWGYLTLINLKLNHTNEAKVCYRIAVKNNIQGDLLNKIQKEFEELQQ